MSEEYEAGRALDFQVAEVVMYWRRDRHPKGDIWHSPPIDGVAGHGGSDFVPCYSTYIGAAWSVVEKMRERFKSVDIMGDHIWTVRIGGVDDWIGSHASLPLAICRAALAAVAAGQNKEA